VPFDLTFDQPHFAELLHDIVGDAGGPGDGFDALFSVLVDGIDATGTIFDILLPDEVAASTAIAELDPIAAALPVQAGSDADAEMTGEIGKLDTHFAGLVPPPTPPPTPPPGTPPGGPAPCPGTMEYPKPNPKAPAGYQDLLDFGTVKVISGEAIQTYSFKPTTECDWKIPHLVYEQFPIGRERTFYPQDPSGQQYKAGETAHIPVNAPLINPGEYSGWFGIATDFTKDVWKVYMQMKVLNE